MSDEVVAQHLRSFFGGLKPLIYQRRSLILHAHDTSTSVFYIKSGYVRVYRISDQGEELTLMILKPNDFFPLTYGISASKNPYFLEAMTPLEIYKAPQELFISYMKSHLELHYELTQRLFIQFNGVLSRMESLVFCNAYTKVAAALLMCAHDFGEYDKASLRISIPLTHRDIATLVGITRETTSLEMKKLEKRGYIKNRNQTIIVCQPEQMREDIFADTHSLSSSPQPLHAAS